MYRLGLKSLHIRIWFYCFASAHWKHRLKPQIGQWNLKWRKIEPLWYLLLGHYKLQCMNAARGKTRQPTFIALSSVPTWHGLGSKMSLFYIYLSLPLFSCLFPSLWKKINSFLVIKHYLVIKVILSWKILSNLSKKWKEAIACAMFLVKDCLGLLWQKKFHKILINFINFLDLAVSPSTDEFWVAPIFWPLVHWLISARTPRTQMSPEDFFSLFFLQIWVLNILLTQYYISDENGNC